jgi:hypothetical protein
MVRAIEVGATLLGYLARALLYSVNILPIVAAPVLVIYGTYQIYPPASFIVAGLILFIVNSRPTDRRVK